MKIWLFGPLYFTIAFLLTVLLAFLNRDTAYLDRYRKFTTYCFVAIAFTLFLASGLWILGLVPHSSQDFFAIPIWIIVLWIGGTVFGGLIGLAISLKLSPFNKKINRIPAQMERKFGYTSPEIARELQKKRKPHEN